MPILIEREKIICWIYCTTFIPRFLKVSTKTWIFSAGICSGLRAEPKETRTAPSEIKSINISMLLGIGKYQHHIKMKGSTTCGWVHEFLELPLQRLGILQLQTSDLAKKSASEFCDHLCWIFFSLLKKTVIFSLSAMIAKLCDALDAWH